MADAGNSNVLKAAAQDTGRNATPQRQRLLGHMRRGAPIQGETREQSADRNAQNTFAGSQIHRQYTRLAVPYQSALVKRPTLAALLRQLYEAAGDAITKGDASAATEALANLDEALRTPPSGEAALLDKWIPKTGQPSGAGKPSWMKDRANQPNQTPTGQQGQQPTQGQQAGGRGGPGQQSRVKPAAQSSGVGNPSWMKDRDNQADVQASGQQRQGAPKSSDDYIQVMLSELTPELPSKLRDAFHEKAKEAVDTASIDAVDLVEREVKSANAAYDALIRISELIPDKKKYFRKLFDQMASLGDPMKLLDLLEERKNEGCVLAREAQKKLNEPSALKLEPKLQLKYLRDLRAGGGIDDPECKEAMAKLYKAMELDESFKTVDQEKRREVLTNLNQSTFLQGKPGMKGISLREVKNGWESTVIEDKLAFMREVLKIQCKSLETTPIPVTAIPQEFENPNVTGGYSANPPPEIFINTHHPSFDNFDKMLDTIIHENTHNYQDQLVKLLDDGDLDEDDERYEQAVLFRLNVGKGNIHDGPGYMSQPIERHAFLAGIEAKRYFFKDDLAAFKKDLNDQIKSIMASMNDNPRSFDISEIGSIIKDITTSTSHDNLCELEYKITAVRNGN